MESKVTQAKEKKEQLFMQSKHSANRISAETQKQSDAFAADYMAFLNASKPSVEAAKKCGGSAGGKGIRFLYSGYETPGRGQDLCKQPWQGDHCRCDRYCTYHRGRASVRCAY